MSSSKDEGAARACDLPAARDEESTLYHTTNEELEQGTAVSANGERIVSNCLMDYSFTTLDYGELNRGRVGEIVSETRSC